MSLCDWCEEDCSDGRCVKLLAMHWWVVRDDTVASNKTEPDMKPETNEHLEDVS